MQSHRKLPIRTALLRRMPFLGALSAALGLALLLTGCGTGSGTSNASLVRTLNAYIPAAGTNGSLAFVGNSVSLTGTYLGFGQIGNGGTYVVVSSGAFTASASGPTVTTPIQLAGQTLSGNNAAYTLVSAGEAGQTGTLVPQLLLIPNYTANQISLPTGDVAIRVVNLALNANPIGLFATNNSVPSAALTTGVGSIAYGYSSAANPYVAVATTQLTNMALVDVTQPQTALSLSLTSNLNTFTFTAGQAYTLYVIGQPGNNAAPLSALWVLDYPTLT